MTLIDRLPALLNREPNIRLIIIDSLAALFRSEEILFQHKIKTKTLQYFGLAMQTLCHRYNLAIVCINQVKSRCSIESFDRVQRKSLTGIKVASEVMKSHEEKRTVDDET